MRLQPPLEGIGIKPGIYKTQSFGQNLNNYGQFGMKGHNGIDWAAPKGTPVLAVQDGRIEFGTDPQGYGNFARLYFDDYDCIYGHLQRFEGVARKVRQGEVIGYVNSTGFSTGNHLHFGIRKIINGQVVDYNNGYFGYFDPEPFFYMDFYKVSGESTIVAFYLDKYYEIATKPADYTYIKAKFGIPDTLHEVGRDVVNSKRGGQVVVGLTFVSA